MIVYKYFIKLILKHKQIILAYTIMFLLLAMINGSSTGEAQMQFAQTKLSIGVVDNANSDLSRGLIEYLGENNDIIEMKEDEGYIKEQIFLQVVDGVMMIPRDFDERVVSQTEAIKLYKDERKVGAFYLEQQIEKYLVFASTMYQNEQLDLERLSVALKEEAEVQIIAKDSRLNTGANNWFKSYYNFTGYIIIAVYVTIIGLVMLELKDEKIENRMRVSSKKHFHFNWEIYLGQISLGVFITSTFILGSMIYKGQHIGEVDFNKYVINIIVYSFSILCFAFLISNLTRYRLLINGISTVVSLGVSFISGVMVPQEFLSEKVLAMAKFFPTYYFVAINEKTIHALGDIRYELFMQLMFGVVFLLLGHIWSRQRLTYE